jgi:uncharacterized protein with von Willebrand factor type A (vWA) domain
LDLPIQELPRMYAEIGAPPGLTDVIFLTDARARIPADLRARFLAWKKTARARVISLVIDNPPADLAGVSDEVHSVRSLDPAGDAVGRVLSL